MASLQKARKNGKSSTSPFKTAHVQFKLTKELNRNSNSSLATKFQSQVFNLKQTNKDVFSGFSEIILPRVFTETAKLGRQKRKQRLTTRKKILRVPSFGLRKSAESIKTKLSHQSKRSTDGLFLDWPATDDDAQEGISIIRSRSPK